MKRWLWRVFEWLFPVEWLTPPMQPHPLTPSPSTERGNADEPLWVDAGLVGMKREVGIVFRKFPSVAEIHAVTGVGINDAEWIWNACYVGDRVYGVVLVNDIARSLAAGVPITEIRLHGLERMLTPPEWERK